MAGSVWIVLVLLLGAGVAWALRPVRTLGPASPSQAWVAAERHARRVTASAWAALLPLPFLLGMGAGGALHGPSRGAFVAALPGIAGIAFLAVHAAGELTWPRPQGAVRRAPLVRRRIRDVAPRALSGLTVAWFVLLGTLLTVCGLAAGTGGRSLSALHADGATSTSSPFPGVYYGRTIAPAMLVLALGCLGVLALVARRAAVCDTSPADDTALRRTSARRVLAGVQLAVAWTLAGCLLFAASSVASVQPRWADAFGPGSAESVGAVGRVAALALVVASVVVAVRASRSDRRAPEPQDVGDHARPRVSA
ncbi:hypothetical protein [Cellulomonas sp. ICMP 17802]|uniref:hypothetical protein n=1 Tax=Cellulomonas sp. ICMP 17802 TaxID=3239199 RepID=UPI00351BAF4E